MCGIGGWFGPANGGDSEVMRAALAQRGPDGSGIWRGEGATLVHTRLAILDLSDAGAQPMAYRRSEAKGQESGDRGQESEGKGQESKESTVFPLNSSSKIQNSKSASSVLVFNGEIYNHVELRKDLEKRGETFTGHSDTEVLLRLLVREGANCLPKLAGMFAFAYWDEKTGEALLARDAYGIKPLYYRVGRKTLTFASESRVLRRDGDAVDSSALRDYFLWGSVPEPQTPHLAIRQIPAGHCLRWKGGQCEVRKWAGRQRTEVRGRRTENRDQPRSVVHKPRSAAAAAREALLESMRRHLVSDVPVGVFLSGGIDSTAILALVREVLGPVADIRTFSIGFDDPAYDESCIARRTAEHFDARHTEWRMTQEEGVAEIPAFLAAVDQPSIDGFNTWCVSKLARREGMKVVLSGLGGDEWFAGYGSFVRVPRFRRLHRMLGPLRPLLACVLEACPPGSPWCRLASFLRGEGSWLEAFHAQRGIFTPKEAADLVRSLTGQSPASADWRLDEIPDDPRAVVSHLEVTRYMRNQLLRDSDVFSMAHGLELRVPFVDVRLAETLLSLPPTLRLRQGKKLLLEAVPEMPEWVKNQPKRGFRFPFQQWMEGQFGELLVEARETSPVPLSAWYRTWAVAAAIRAISQL
jgi:asparagine synthase (glutamine-hydrolysing)